MATYNRWYVPTSTLLWNRNNYNTGYDALSAVANIVDPNITVPFASWDEAINVVSNIVNWTNTPATTTTSTVTPFSTLDNLNMQSQAWANTNPNIATAYQNLASGLWSYSNVANQIWDFYNTAASQISWREADYANAQYQLANQLNQDIASQRDYIYSMFGPQWQLTQEINRYYDDMWNYLASEGWRQMANVAAQWAQSWASLGLLRAQQNEAYNQAFENYLKVKEQEINAKQSIQAQLIDYMTKLRQEYGNTTNQYILSQYQRANDLLNSLDADLKNQYTNLALATIQSSGSTWISTTGTGSSWPLVVWSSNDSINNIDTTNQWSWWAITTSEWANNSSWSSKSWSNSASRLSTLMNMLKLGGKVLNIMS